MSAASLVALVIVATITSADALATVALVIAVLAFVIQIIVFIVQMVSANEQARVSAEINSQTRELLSEVGAYAKATNDAVNAQFARTLDGLLDRLKSDALPGEGDEIEADQEDATDEDGKERDEARIRAELVEELRREANKTLYESNFNPGPLVLNSHKILKHLNSDSYRKAESARIDYKELPPHLRELVRTLRKSDDGMSSDIVDESYSPDQQNMLSEMGFISILSDKVVAGPRTEHL